MEYLFPAIFLLLGAGLIVLAFVQRAKAKKAEEWPVAPGVILNSGLSEHRSHDSDGSSSISYRPEVQYQYSIMGQKYTGNRIFFGNASYDYNTANRKIAPYPQGTQVNVHYDPANPSNAVLETKASGNWILILIGIVFLVIGVMSAVHLPIFK